MVKAGCASVSKRAELVWKGKSTRIAYLMGSCSHVDSTKVRGRLWKGRAQVEERSTETRVFSVKPLFR